MQIRILRVGLVAGAIWTVACPDTADAHGFAGARFFPATLISDDPFVADEWSFPTTSWSKDEDGTANLSVSADLAKRLTSSFAVEIAATWLDVRPPGGPAVEGFDNLALGAKYQLFVDPVHETILAIGGDADIGGTGAKRIGADSFSTITPTFYFGKGFGDIAPASSLLRPIAVTGTAGVSLPIAARATGGPNDALQFGLAVEYSLTYLQTQVVDAGLRPPFDRMIPLVEFSLQKPIDQVSQKVTGNIAPGVLWAGQYFQLGAEALIPVNRASGRSVGFIAQFHLFIDDLFPQTIGRPLFGA
ncbi:MAG TPA: hypothetical protein VFW28_17440 [Micropepsaceae bacterium]|nr:hypothetical protein [Micropepsaceae bacterium]